MIHRIMIWCRGYVKVCLPGASAERFINLCRNHGIVWWNVFWDHKTHMVLGCIQRTDYFRLRSIVRKTGILPVIRQRKGGYFWLQKGLRRGSFWCGVGCMLGMVFFLSGRIWGIEIQGQSCHTRESILRDLEAEGVYGGMSGKGISCSKIEAVLRKRYADVGWVSVEQSGSKLYIRLDEVLLQEAPTQETPANLVAEESGTVVSIVTKQGTPKVRAGDSVKKGQTLISGTIRLIGDNAEVTGKKRVRAEGTVVLRSSYWYRDTLPGKYWNRKYSGKSRVLYQICVGQKNLFVYNPLKSLESYEKCDIIREGGRICPFLSQRFPVSLWRKTYREVTGRMESCSAERARQILQRRFAYAMSQKEAQGYQSQKGTLQVTEEKEGYAGKAHVVYSREQTQYQSTAGGSTTKAGRKIRHVSHGNNDRDTNGT